MKPRRVLVTEKAKKVIDKLREENGELIFHQSGGCCDGSAPMCFPKNEFRIGGSDVWLGNIHRCDFYTSRDQFEYLKSSQLTIDIVPGRGSSFSIEIPLGLRFITRSRLFTKEEMKDLAG